jgi:hypothetical protein
MSSWHAPLLWTLLIVALGCAVTGMALGIYCERNKANKATSVPPPLRVYEAESIVHPLADNKSLPNAITIQFKEPHLTNPFFEHEVRSTLDGYVRTSFIRELTSTSAVIQVIPSWQVGGSQSLVYVPSAHENLISAVRADHVQHRNTIKAVAVPYKIAADATLNASDTFPGLSILYYSDRTYSADGDGHSTLFYSFYSPLTNAWEAPQKVTQYLNGSDLGRPFDFALASLNSRPAIAWVNPQATNGTTTINFRHLTKTTLSGASDSLVRTITTPVLANSGTTWASSTLAMSEFVSTSGATSAVVGYITDVSSVQTVSLVVAPVGDTTTPTYNFGSAITVASTTTNANITTAARNLQLTPLNVTADGVTTRRLVVSFTVAGTTNFKGVAYISSTNDIATATWSLIAVTADAVVESTNLSNFVVLAPTENQLVAVWQNATTSALNYCYSATSAAGVVTFPTDKVKVLTYKCNSTFTASVIAPGEFGVVYQVASDETVSKYRNLPMYAYVTGESATPTYSSLYLNDGYSTINSGSCVGLTAYENAPAIFLSGSPLGGTALINFQGNANNRSMTPGLTINYHVH